MSLYEIFYNTGYGSDITVKCGDIELKLHKKILIKHSGYFEAMIPHCGDIIDMDICDIDLDPVWLEKLIKSWYTGDNKDILCRSVSFPEYYRYFKMWKFLICYGNYPCLMVEDYSVENAHNSMGIKYYGKGYKHFELDGTGITNFINKLFGLRLIKKVVKCSEGKIYIHFMGNEKSVCLELSGFACSCSISFTSFVPHAIELLNRQEINSL